MTKTILAIVEFERFPLEVATRAARIAKLYGCDLKLVLSDPTISFLRSSFRISAATAAAGRSPSPISTHFSIWTSLITALPRGKSSARTARQEKYGPHANLLARAVSVLDALC